MNPDDNLTEAIDLLQLLGLNECTARCYVGLTRMDTATARQLSEVADVSKTQVYDETRVLESQGLIEIDYSSPKQFRAVPIEEAINRIRERYETRFAELQEAVNLIEPVKSTDGAHTQQVWSVTGQEEIDSRATQLLKEASSEVVLALGEQSPLSESFAEALTEVGENVELHIYVPTETMRDRIQRLIPDGTTVLSGLENLHGSTATGEQGTLGRILLIDQSVSLISSIDSDTDSEQAVFSQGPQDPIYQLMIDGGLLTTPESKP